LQTEFFNVQCHYDKNNYSKSSQFWKQCTYWDSFLKVLSKIKYKRNFLIHPQDIFLMENFSLRYLIAIL